LPNAEMIRNVRLQLSSDPIIETILDLTDRSRGLVLDTRTLAENIFGDYMMTNMIAVGAAYQAGLLPISAASVEAAIRLNKVQVEGNIAAFRVGRLYVYDRVRADKLAQRSYYTFADRTRELEQRPSAERVKTRETLLARVGAIDTESKRLLAIRIDDLIDYQN